VKGSAVKGGPFAVKFIIIISTSSRYPKPADCLIEEFDA
jgi:hypothetical protein